MLLFPALLAACAATRLDFDVEQRASCPRVLENRSLRSVEDELIGRIAYLAPRLALLPLGCEAEQVLRVWTEHFVLELRRQGDLDEGTLISYALSDTGRALNVRQRSLHPAQARSLFDAMIGLGAPDLRGDLILRGDEPSGVGGAIGVEYANATRYSIVAYERIASQAASEKDRQRVYAIISVLLIELGLVNRWRETSYLSGPEVNRLSSTDM